MDNERFKTILNSEYSLDDYEYPHIETALVVKDCPLCKKKFYPEGRNGSRQRYCKRTHVIDCIICGTPIKQKEASEKYGTVKFTCCKECTNKAKVENAKATMKERYGVENALEIPEFNKKATISRNAKAKETAQKARKTLTERYGGMGTASPILREKIEKTTMERYGVTNPSYSPGIKKKISESNSSIETIKKYEATAIANYGVNRPAKTEEVKNKIKQTNLERYGVECTYQLPEAVEHYKQTCIERYGVENALFSDYGKQKAREGYIAHLKDGSNRISKVNQTIASVLKDKFNLETEFEFYLSTKINDETKSGMFDLHIKDTNILLEIDPSYTHSTIGNHWNNEGLDIDYHLTKTKIAENNGYHCIHIFDWDDLDKIYMLMQKRSNVYARNCKLIEIDNLTADQFLNKYHIQGTSKGSKYRYGLIYRGNLVEVMTFGKSRYNKKYEWELLRLCTVPEYNVVGGASKLFKKFIEDGNPSSIMSYCDRAKFTGNVYTKIGMKLHHTSDPAKVWSKGCAHVTDNLLRQRGYDQLFDANYGKGTSNEQLMLNDGWLPIYDCGQYVFEWIKH